MIKELLNKIKDHITKRKNVYVSIICALCISASCIITYNESLPTISDENGIPVNREHDHGFGTRSIAAFCNKYGAYYQFRATADKFTLYLNLWADVPLLFHRKKGVSQMQNLRHPRRGSADLGENRRIWGVRRTKVRRAPKSAIEKARIKYGEFRRNSTDYCLISKISKSGTFFLSSTGFFDLVKCDSPKTTPKFFVWFLLTNRQKRVIIF